MADVAIIGTANLELILGPLSRIPEWGQLSLAPRMEVRKAGSAPSVAIPLHRLGVKSTVIASVGKDDFGYEIKKALRVEGLDTSGIIPVQGMPTGICVSVYREDGERLYISSPGAVEALNLDMILKQAPRALNEVSFVLLTGYFLLAGLGYGGTRKLLTLCKEQGKKTFLDPGWDAGGWKSNTRDQLNALLPLIDVFLPNQEELSALFGTPPEEPEVLSQRALQLGPSAVFIKRGARGASVLCEEGYFEEKVHEVKVAHRTAAGESFNAGVLYGFLKGLSPQETLRFANALAALYLERGLLNSPRVEEVKAFLASK